VILPWLLKPDDARSTAFCLAYYVTKCGGAQSPVKLFSTCWSLAALLAPLLIIGRARWDEDAHASRSRPRRSRAGGATTKSGISRRWAERVVLSDISLRITLKDLSNGLSPTTEIPWVRIKTTPTRVLPVNARALRNCPSAFATFGSIELRRLSPTTCRSGLWVIIRSSRTWRRSRHLRAGRPFSSTWPSIHK
jgi:hypothetical protein